MIEQGFAQQSPDTYRTAAEIRNHRNAEPQEGESVRCVRSAIRAYRDRIHARRFESRYSRDESDRVYNAPGEETVWSCADQERMRGATS